jgi:hypothetical protein
MLGRLSISGMFAVRNEGYLRVTTHHQNVFGFPLRTDQAVRFTYHWVCSLFRNQETEFGCQIQYKSSFPKAFCQRIVQPGCTTPDYVPTPVTLTFCRLPPLS